MKVCIVCYGLKEENVRLQPWRYISEIATGLSNKDINVTIITNGAPGNYIAGIKIMHLDKLRKLPFIPNNELISLIKSENPNVILWSVSALDYLYLSTFEEINIPVIGMFTGPIYKLSEITRIGIREMLTNIRFLSGHIIYSSLPSFFIRNFVSSPSCNKVFVMSRKNKEIIEEMGVFENKIVHVPTGISKHDFEASGEYSSIIKKYNLEKNKFNILYFGSPLTIRGIDSIIKAVLKVRDEYPYVKLLILSRRGNNELSREETRIKNLIQKLNLESNVQVISGFLDKDEVRKFISFSDLIALPFKIVPSDVPTSILESMAMGKTVISTDIDGIPELLEEGRGIIVKPNKEDDLAKKIVFSVQNRDLIKNMGKKAAAYMQTYPTWYDVSELVISEIIKFR